MALPNITQYILGTREPISYVEPALRAYLSVAQEMRAQYAQMEGTMDKGQQMEMRGLQEGRNAEMHQSQMLDADINRTIKVDDQNWKHEQRDMDRQMFPMDLERAALANEAARMDLEVVKPLQAQTSFLRLQEMQLRLTSEADAARVQSAKQAKLGEALDITDRIFSGEIPTPEPSVIESPLALEDQTLRAPGLQAGTLYWNHDLSVPMLAVPGEGGVPRIAAPDGDYSASGDGPHRWTALRAVSPEDVPGPDDLHKLFSEAKAPEYGPDQLRAMDQARAAMAHLNQVEAGFSDVPAAKAPVEARRSFLMQDPAYRAVLEQETRQGRDDRLRIALGGDSDFDQWTRKNPGLHGVFRQLPDSDVSGAVSHILARQKEERAAAEKAEPWSPAARPRSAGETTALIGVQTKVAEARGDVEGARARVAGAIGTQKAAAEASLHAAEAKLAALESALSETT